MEHSQDYARLNELRARMSEKQQRDMAELIERELYLRARGAGTEEQESVSKKTSCSPLGCSVLVERLQEGIRSMKNSISQFGMKWKASGLKKEAHGHMQSHMQNEETDTGMVRLGGGRYILPKSALPAGTTVKIILIALIVAVSALKIVTLGDPDKAKDSVLATGAISESKASSPASRAMLAQAPAPAEFDIAVSAEWSEHEKQILTQLDSRRVELEKRREVIDRREQDVQRQADALAERMAELRSLTARLNEAREIKDHQREARLEQLAQVYGEMAPKEAAPLIAKLEDNIALGLLQRMPGKRMGQILSLIPADRAVELTRGLTKASQ